MLFKKNKEPDSKPQKEVEPQFYKSVTGDTTINYHVYYLTRAEKILYFAIAFIVGGAVGYLFYGGLGKDEYGNPTMLTWIINAVVIVTAGTLSGKLYLPIRHKQILESRKHKLRVQFRDMLEALSTSIGAGKNIPESFTAVYTDLKNQYEEDAFILHELEVINAGLANGMNVEEMLADFGRRSACPDIEDFAGVFQICYRKGGNIKETIRNTCGILGDKMTVMEEIETTISGSKNEQYIMLVMPVLLIGMIKVSSPDFASNFATPSGVIATTIALATFVASYFLGQKLLDIRV